MTDESKQIRDRAYREIQLERYRQERDARANAGSGERDEQHPSLRDDEIGRGFAGGTDKFKQQTERAVEEAFDNGGRVNEGILYKTAGETGASEAAESEVGEILEDYAVSTPEGNDVETLAVYVTKYPHAAGDLIEFAADRDLIADQRFEEMSDEQMSDSSEGRVQMYDREVRRINAPKTELTAAAAAVIPAVLYKTESETAERQLHGDEVFTEFQTMLEQAGIENMLDAPTGSATFQTVGNAPKKFEMILENGEISFANIAAAGSGQPAPVEKISGITFALNSARNYQYTSSFERDSKGDLVSTDFDKAEALGQVAAWKNQGVGEKIVVTQFTAADDEDLINEIKTANKANIEKYVSRQKGFELLAEIGVKAAAFDAAEFRRTSEEQKVWITAQIAGREIERDISRNELLQERQAIARADVAAAKKTGVLEMIGEDERQPLEIIERRHYAKALLKAESSQQPLMKALDEAFAAKVSRLDEITAAAERLLDKERVETAMIVKQTGTEKSERVAPVVMPEKLWLEQNNAVRRGDAETFSRLEEIHRRSDLPRPNDVFARLKAMEAVAASRERQTEADNMQGREGRDLGDEKVVVRLTAENDSLLVKDLEIASSERKKNEKSASASGDRREKSAAEPETQSAETAAKSAAYASQAAALRSAARQAAWQPLMSKINPLSPIQGTLSWITSPKETLNAHINPVEIIKNDPGLQIIRAVAGYIDKNNQAAALEKLSRDTLADDRLREQLTEKSAGPEAERLSSSVKTAVENEEKLRDGLKRNPAVNKDLLEMPERSLSDAEIKQVGETAVKTGDAVETREYREFIKLDDEFAESIGATEHTLATDSMLAEARAVWQANQAITAIRALADGSLEVEMNPAQLSTAVEHLNTADVLGEFQGQFAEHPALENLSLDQTLELEGLLPGNNPLTPDLENRVTNIGKDLMEQFREPVSSAEQQIMKDLMLSDETLNQFAQIRQNEQLLDALAEQAELAAQNQVPYQGAAQNFTVVNPNDEIEAREMKFWAKDRADREAKIAADKVQSQSLMTEEEKVAEVTFEAEVAAEVEVTAEYTVAVLA